MGTAVFAWTLVFLGIAVSLTCADIESKDLGQDWLAEARKNKNADLELAILKGIEFLHQQADQVNANSNVRVYDVVLKAKPGRDGWDLHMNVDGKQTCKLSLKRDKGKDIELDVLSGCAKHCAHHQKVSCQNI